MPFKNQKLNGHLCLLKSQKTSVSVWVPVITLQASPFKVDVTNIYANLKTGQSLIEN